MRFLLILLIFISCSLQSCSKFITPGYDKPTSVKVLEQNNKTKRYVIQLDVPIKNENKIGFRVKTKNIKISLNGKEMATASVINRVKIKKDTTLTYPILVELVLGKKFSFTKLGLKLMFNPRMKIGIEGVAKGKKFIFGKKVPFKFEKKVNLRELMSQSGL